MSKRIDRSKNIYIYNIHFANFLILNGGIVTGAGIHKETGKVFIAFDYESTREGYKKFDERNKQG